MERKGCSHSAMNGYTANTKMREIIDDNDHLLMVISRFDIAFGFGDSSVKETCDNNKVDCDTFLAVANLLGGYGGSNYRISLHTLMGYLKHAHTSFIDSMLPTIRRKLIEAINYSETNDVSFLLMKFFDDYVVEVKRHMDYENDTIFAYVERLLDGTIDENFGISKFSVNHSPMASKLNELKDLFIYHYDQKDNDLLSSALFDIIECESDLLSHFEVENRLFLPAVEELEASLRSRLMEEEDDEMAAEETDTDPQLASLSDREKEIVKLVACGYSNKEIADKLCLSIHTITTHRRNISTKLSIHSPAGLTIFAILHHLVELKDVNPKR